MCLCEAIAEHFPTLQGDSRIQSRAARHKFRHSAKCARCTAIGGNCRGALTHAYCQWRTVSFTLKVTLVNSSTCQMTNFSLVERCGKTPPSRRQAGRTTNTIYVKHTNTRALCPSSDKATRELVIVLRPLECDRLAWEN